MMFTIRLTTAWITVELRKGVEGFEKRWKE
jgi:hypothetical protein